MSEPRLLVTVPGETLRRAIGTPPDGVDIELWDLAGPPPADRIDLVVPPYMGAADRLGALAGVTTRLVQSQSIGYDDVPAVLPPGQVFANAASVHETSTAELAMALLLTRRRLVRPLHTAAAFDAGTARVLSLRSPLARWWHDRMVRAGVIRTTPTGASWLDREAWARYRAVRRRRVAVVLVVLIVGLVGLALRVLG